MRKFFWDDPYLQRLTTCVADIQDNCILLEETIAFSFSGGQESDNAKINGLAVINSEIKGHQIYYQLNEGHGFKIGDVVTMEIDWIRRFRLMRLHFAAELVLELVSRLLPVEKIGAHIAEQKARIDFVYNQNISHIFERVLTEYNQIILNDLAIVTDFSDVENQRRFWEIKGFSKVPCGGTHVKSTREVGAITLKRVNIGGGKERIEIKLVHA